MVATIKLMNKSRLVAAYRLIFAGILVVTIIAQYMQAMHADAFRPINFFSFFTIESNILAAVVLLIGGLCSLQGKGPAWLPMLRGAVTLYMTTTGLVYVTLLAHLEVSLPWANFVLHYVAPLVIFIDWLLDRPLVRISSRQALVWLVFPVLYLAYSLLRGPHAEWYPYPFLEPTNQGYLRVFLMCVGIGAFIYILAVLLAKVTTFGKKISRPKRKAA